MPTPRSKAPTPPGAPMPTMYTRHRKKYPQEMGNCNHICTQHPTRGNGALANTSNLARSS